MCGAHPCRPAHRRRSEPRPGPRAGYQTSARSRTIGELWVGGRKHQCRTLGANPLLTRHGHPTSPGAISPGAAYVHPFGAGLAPGAPSPVPCLRAGRVKVERHACRATWTRAARSGGLWCVTGEPPAGLPERRAPGRVALAAGGRIRVLGPEAGLDDVGGDAVQLPGFGPSSSAARPTLGSCPLALVYEDDWHVVSEAVGSAWESAGCGI